VEEGGTNQYPYLKGARVCECVLVRHAGVLQQPGIFGHTFGQRQYFKHAPASLDAATHGKLRIFLDEAAGGWVKSEGCRQAWNRPEWGGDAPRFTVWGMACSLEQMDEQRPEANPPLVRLVQIVKGERQGGGEGWERSHLVQGQYHGVQPQGGNATPQRRNDRCVHGGGTPNKKW
jgi:hypothetical protein